MAETGEVKKDKKMLKGHLPRVIYHQVYERTKRNGLLFWETGKDYAAFPGTMRLAMKELDAKKDTVLRCMPSK